MVPEPSKEKSNIRQQAEQEFSSLGNDALRTVLSGAGNSGPEPKSSGAGGNSFFADFISGIDRSGFDPVRADAEDSIMAGLRDQTILENYAAPDKAQSVAAGPSNVLPANAYYPGIGENIVKGYVGGKYPIFAAGGGLFPMGVFDARRQVMVRSAEREKARRQAQQEEVKRFDAYDPVEQDINNIYWNVSQQVRNQAFKDGGKHAPDLLGDPNYSGTIRLKKLNQQLETLSSFTNTVADLTETKMKDVVDGKQFATVESRALMDKYRRGINEVIQSIGPNSTDEDISKVNRVLASYIGASQSALSMMGIYDKFFDQNIKPDMQETMPSLYEALENDDYSVITTQSREYLDQDRLDMFADQIWAEHEYDIKLSNPGKTEDEYKQQVKKEVAARFANRTNVSYSTIKKPKQSGGKNASLSNDKYYFVESDPTNISPLAQNKYDSAFLLGAKNRRDLQNVPVVLDTKVFYEDDKEWAGEPNRKIYMDVDGIMYGDNETASGTKIRGWYLFGTTEYVHKSTGMEKGDRVKTISVPLSLDKYDPSLGIISGDMVLSSLERHTDFTKKEIMDMLRKAEQSKEPTGPISPEEFNKQWEALKPGETLTGPDGKNYVKQ